MSRVRLLAATIIVASWAGQVSMAAKATASKPAEAAAPRIAVFRLSGEMREGPPQFDLGLEMEERNSLYQLLERFRKAAKDPTLKGVVLTFDEAQIGWGQTQQLRRSIKELQKADKDVYCYLESAGNGTYYAAAAASQVCMTPIGDLNLIGMHVEQSFFKGLLDKIKVEADIEHVGAYKGAGEPFTRTEPSPEAKEMIEWLVKDLFDQLLAGIASDRKLTRERVSALVDEGPYTAARAKQAGLIDETMYAEEFIESLKDRYGSNLVLDHKYGRKKGPEIDFSSPFAFFKLLGEAGKKRSRTKPEIAVIYVDGMIMTGKTEEGFFGDSGTVGSTTLRRVLNKAAADEQVKAVVLRVNSPGGSALASDIIWHAAADLAEDKPLVVSMGDVAASGGYYVAMGAPTVFAEEGTITGSIGVVGGKLVTKGLWDWAGVTTWEMNLGQNADLYSSNRRFDDRQREVVRKYMREVYDEFTGRVKDSRGDRLKGDIEELAGGRVYTGRQALAKGLVDRLGGLNDAVAFAAEKAELKDYELRILPEPQNFVEAIIKGLSGETDDDEAPEQISLGRGWLRQMPEVAQVLRALERIDPSRARLAADWLKVAETLAGEHAVMVVPSAFTIR